MYRQLRGKQEEGEKQEKGEVLFEAPIPKTMWGTPFHFSEFLVVSIEGSSRAGGINFSIDFF
jgi:hypothetical protein